MGVVLIKTWGTFVADDIIFGAQLPSILFTFYLLVSSAAIYSGEAKTEGTHGLIGNQAMILSCC